MDKDKVQAKILIDLTEYERLGKLEDKLDAAGKRISDLLKQVAEKERIVGKKETEKEEKAAEKKEKADNKEDNKEDKKEDKKEGEQEKDTEKEKEDASNNQFGAGSVGSTVEREESSEAESTEKSKPSVESEPIEAKSSTKAVKHFLKPITVQGRYRHDSQELLAKLEQKPSIIKWDETGKISLWGKETNLRMHQMVPLIFYPINYSQEDTEEIRLWLNALVDAGCGEMIKNNKLLYQHDWYYIGA